MIVIDIDMPKSCELCRAVCSRYNENEKDIEFFCGIDGGYISNYVEDLKRKRDACPIKCDIKDIKAEIEGLMSHDDYMVDGFNVLDIIDKYIGAK